MSRTDPPRPKSTSVSGGTIPPTSGVDRSEAERNPPQPQTPVPPRKLSPKEAFRENFDSIIQLLAVICAMRACVGEAYRIPSGSMASSLFGAQKRYVCTECGQVSFVDSRQEVEMGRPVETAECQCCRHRTATAGVKSSWGDYIVVSKAMYDFIPPRRWEVVVFKCPDTDKAWYMTYIKRLVGLPGETIHIDRGDLLVSSREAAKPVTARKTTDALLAMRRLVDDDDRRPTDLGPKFRRWDARAGFQAASRGFNATGAGELVYRHLGREAPAETKIVQRLITDHLDYNSDNQMGNGYLRKTNWVGDLILEARWMPSRNSMIELELVEGERVYVARIDPAGAAELLENGRSLAKTAFPSAATLALRFANVDDRLALWVNERLVFGEGIELQRPEGDAAGPGPGDLEPAKIRVNGAGTLDQLKLHRDSYYTRPVGDLPGGSVYTGEPDYDHGDPLPLTPGDLASWRRALQRLRPATYRIPDDAYFVLGDNSQQSLDARCWSRPNAEGDMEPIHHVPKRLMIGRALGVYMPLFPTNRARIIH
jgi:signal peptidase I